MLFKLYTWTDVCVCLNMAAKPDPETSSTLNIPQTMDHVQHNHLLLLTFYRIIRFIFGCERFKVSGSFCVTVFEQEAASSQKMSV